MQSDGTGLRMLTDGSDPQRLTHSPGNDAHNAYSPDGAWIVFTSTRGGFKDESALHPHNPQPQGDVFVMRADGSDVRRLTDDQFEEGTPAWIPHNRWMAFVPAPARAARGRAMSRDRRRATP